jgi:hypothetical protein
LRRETDEDRRIFYDGERRLKKLEKNLINQGVRQECRLSPLLFDLYLDHVIMEWQDNNLPQTNIFTTIFLPMVNGL